MLTGGLVFGICVAWMSWRFFSDDASEETNSRLVAACRSLLATFAVLGAAAIVLGIVSGLIFLGLVTSAGGPP